jgi:hypothetical protein
MTRGRWLLALLILVLTAACADQKSGQTAPVADTPENRKAAAQRYLEAMTPEEMLRSMTANAAQRMPEPNRKLFMEAMSDQELVKSVHRISQEALVKHFTADELNALAAFYGSPAGKSTRSKFGPYMGDVMPQVSEEVRKVFTKLQEQQKSPDTPKAEEPKPGQPKAEQPKAEPAKPALPKPDQSKVAPAKPAQPKAEPPKPEQPKSEKPQAEQPKGK